MLFFQEVGERRKRYLFFLLSISATVSQLLFGPAWQQGSAIQQHCNYSAPHPGLLLAPSSVFPPTKIWEQAAVSFRLLVMSFLQFSEVAMLVCFSLYLKKRWMNSCRILGWFCVYLGLCNFIPVY